MGVFARIRVTLGVTLLAIVLTCGVMAGVCLDVVAINKNIKAVKGNKGYIFKSDRVEKIKKSIKEEKATPQTSLPDTPTQ